MAAAGLRALVTGASAGIGAAFARALRDRGHGLVLVARREERLRLLQQELGGAEAVAVVCADLATPEGPRAVFDEVNGASLGVDLLVNNAGVGHTGRFQEEPYERVVGMVDLNARAMVALTRLFLPAMLQRGEGSVINVASTAAFQPIPYFATYSATKAFAAAFTAALAVELKGSGVRVQLLCPGPTETEFFGQASHEGLLANRLPRASARQVVEASLRGLDRGRDRVVVGWPNRLLAVAVSLVPMPLARAVAARLYKPR
ncbi:MAG TPA: SDR family oxidoreductase [Vicinamibacteria bacterium]|nr:SDR family oxidoreductase [Vicinamibacteria bacterium]